MIYANTADVSARLGRTLSQTEQNLCATLLEDAAVIIDAFNANASLDAKKIVSCRMVVRAIGDGTDAGVPMGASQGSMSALGYSQSWTIGAGAIGGGAGELYIGRLEKKLLGSGNSIGSYSPTEALVPDPVIPEAFL